MKYALVYTSRAVKDIKKLDEFTRKRIGKTFLHYQTNPLMHAEKLIDSGLGAYRWRIGDYRVIFDVLGREIVVLRVGQRKEIYKR